MVNTSTMDLQKGVSDADLRPVLVLINKRLRNNRKKLRGIEEIQAKAESGKELNADQVHGKLILGHLDFFRLLGSLRRAPMAGERKASEAWLASTMGHMRELSSRTTDNFLPLSLNPLPLQNHTGSRPGSQARRCCGH